MINTDLVEIKGGKPVTTSLKVAEVFEKQHFNVVRDIKNLGVSPEFNLFNFEEIEYEDSRNRKYKAYAMTQDGFTMLAMGYTGRQAIQFKEAYIAEFNRMRVKLEGKGKNGLIPLEILIENAKHLLEQEQRISNLEYTQEASRAYLREQAQIPSKALFVNTRKAVDALVRSYSFSNILPVDEVWNTLYREFEIRYHKNIQRASRQTRQSKISYIEQIGYIAELYEVAKELLTPKP